MLTQEDIKVCKDKNKFNFNFNTPIYRVFKINHLIKLFEIKKNTLVKPELWDDPWENFLLKQTPKYNGQNVSLDILRNNLFGQCWTLNEKETDALWRIYSPRKNGVRVKTTLKKLWDSCWDIGTTKITGMFYIGKILYQEENKLKKYFKNSQNLESTIFSAHTLLYKRMEFEHEKEIRLIYYKNSKNKNLTTKTRKIYRYKIDPIKLFEEMLFDPQFDDVNYNKLKGELIKYGYKKSKIKKSQLYQIPNLKLEL